MKEYYKIDDNAVKEYAELYKLTLEEAYKGLNEYAEFYYEIDIQKQPKPPLGITPKHIYELQRVQDICRALHEYSRYVNSIYSCELMINWSEELNERLSHLKYDMEDNENIMLK